MDIVFRKKMYNFIVVLNLIKLRMFHFLLANIPATMHRIPPPPTFSMVSTLHLTTSPAMSRADLWSISKLDQALEVIHDITNDQ